jgi:topoisomerase IA-like protein
MENNNIFLGKIEKNGCYVNNGKYGYFLTCGKKNYKIPEWLEPEEITLEMAKRLILYRQKNSEEWLEKNNNNDTEVVEDIVKTKLKNDLKISNNIYYV